MISFAENNSLIRHHVFGDYVFTPVRNAFNEKTSWWISKMGYTRAFYCFTADTAKEVSYQLGEGRREAYIKMFDDLT